MDDGANESQRQYLSQTVGMYRAWYDACSTARMHKKPYPATGYVGCTVTQGSRGANVQHNLPACM